MKALFAEEQGKDFAQDVIFYFSFFPEGDLVFAFF